MGSPLSTAAAELEDALDQAGGPRALDSLKRRDAPLDLLLPATLGGLLRMAIEEWLVIGTCWVALAYAPDNVRPWLYPVFCLVIAGRLHALGVLLHDAAHLPLRRKTTLVYAIEILCGYPVASTVDAMRYHHLRHHRDSGMETDPYFKTGPQTPLWWLVNVGRGALLLPGWTLRAIVGALSLVAPGLRTAYARIFLQDRSDEDLTSSREVLQCARAELGQLVFQAALVVAALRWPAPVLYGYLIPATITGLLSARRLLLEHTYEHARDRRIETILATTRDNHVDWLGQLLLAPRNVGCHVVHHIHPQAGLEQLPRLREWYRERHPDRYPPT